MNLVASLVVRNELGRYLAPCIDHLIGFCDHVCVLDDASDDGTYEWLRDDRDVRLATAARHDRPRFYEHEGRTRQRLLDYTLDLKPTHVVNLDADEFITDGVGLRRLIGEQPDVASWHIPIIEVWEANPDRYMARVDGGWKTGRTLCWRVPPGRLSFPNRALACGRVPSQVRMGSARASAVSLLHVGWLDESERERRIARYTKHDGGRFHASAHLASLAWDRDDERLMLEPRPWPAGLGPWKDQILEHATVRT